MKVIDSTTVRLRGWETWPEARESATAILFGHLVSIAEPIVSHYRGDLMHDARSIDALAADGPPTFYWAPRETGTTFATDLEAFTQSVGILGGREHAYRVTVRPAESALGATADGRCLWVADFDRLAL